MKVSEVIAKLDRKEWWLPPFQRDFVWNDKTKVVKFVDSLYRGYPIGSVTIWKPRIKDIEELQKIREKIGGRPISAPSTREPVWSTEYILDGQQRLTTIKRIFAGAPFVFRGEEHILHFDIKKEEFRFLKRGKSKSNLVSFHEIISKTNKEIIADLNIKDTGEIIRIGSLLDEVRKTRERKLNYEITDPLKKEDALELFIRFNTGGKPLATENLALGYISIKWHDARDELESFRKEIHRTGFEFDFDFFIRCLSAVSLRQSLSKKIVNKFGEKNVENNWKITAKGIEKLIDFLRGELNLHSNRFIEAENTLVPLVLLFTKKDVVGTARSLLSYAFVVSYLNRRYSGGKFRNLDTDVKRILKKHDPVEDWVKTLEEERETLTNLKPSEIIETPNRTLKLPLFLLLKDRGVTRDLLGRSLIAAAAAEEHKPEFHHIFPRRCLEGTPFEEKKHHIANLTLITSKSNKEIRDKEPSYLRDIEDELKEQHFIPKDEDLYRIARYEDFIKGRQELIAKTLNKFLEKKRGV